MNKLIKKLRVTGYKLSTPPNIEQLLYQAADKIEELHKKLKKKG